MDGKPPTFLKTPIQRLVRALAPTRIVLFGSYAKGTEQPGSDVDLLVITEAASNPGTALRRARQLVATNFPPIDVSLCTTIKARGIKIAVLYTTYLQLPTNSWYMTYIDPFNQGPFGPSPNSEIAQNMQSCASPGLYFEVSPTQGISDAMNALFKKAVADARIAG